LPSLVVALLVGALIDELAEPLRPYSDSNPDRCLVNNCGEYVGAYCFINRVTGFVWGCVVWDGWGDVWWEGVTNPPGPVDRRFGPNPGFLYPEADWVVIDRDKLPEWAVSVVNPGSYVLFSR
jgi:hypothetical protein